MGKRHNYKLGYTVTRLALQGAGLVRPALRRPAAGQSAMRTLEGRLPK